MGVPLQTLKYIRGSTMTKRLKSTGQMTLSLSLATFCRPNSSFAFKFLQHHVQIRHRRDYDEQKAVVVM